ncbi:hypothetical protein Pmar_PMAR022853, partial [Perkinsus marinus ATCC 50983]
MSKTLARSFALNFHLSGSNLTAISSEKLTIISFYNPPSLPDVRHLHPILDLVDSGNDIIIGGDTNGYSHLWGIYSANILSRNSTAWRFGREMEELITGSGLICFNDTDNITPTYHHAASSADHLRSTIDATFGTIDLHVTNWR